MYTPIIYFQTMKTIFSTHFFFIFEKKMKHKE